MRRLAFLVALAAAGACKPTTPATQSPQNASPPEASGGEGAGAEVGAAATDFTLRDLDGANQRLSDYGGKVVLLNFWATWCIPCAAELPHLEALYQQHKGQGFQVLGVAMDGPESIANVGSFARRYNLSFPVLLDEETRVVGIYNPKRTAPLNLIVDRGGRIAKVRQGYSAGDENLIAEDVRKLLAP